MSTPERPFASYHLWSLIAPNAGQQHWHCQMRRGFMKVRQHEPQVKTLLGISTASQQVGLLTQKGIYEFHHNRQLLHQENGVEMVAQLIDLAQTTDEIQQRVVQILHKYHHQPLLLDKHIILLTRGDEGFPKPIVIEGNNYSFRLYATMDCIFQEPDHTLHILDFKTGKSPFDRRQALVYLLAGRYLYPGQELVASFYNLEFAKQSEIIRMSEGELNLLELELANVATKHQTDVHSYHTEEDFSHIFPANPGHHCRFCPFNSICDFSSAV